MRWSMFVAASSFAIGTAMLPSAVLAQATSTGDPAAQDAGARSQSNPDGVQTNADGSTDDDTVVVTGTRIRLPGAKNFEPTNSVTQQYIQDRGLTNVADALNELPGIRGSVTPAQAQGSFGQGVNFINLYNLGSNRTLTLVNNRRVVSSNVNTIFNQGSAGTQVDVNVVPTLLVDRVDVVATGGAPVYGSDAIGGVVNFILNTRLNGVLAQATSGVTSRGDGFRYNLALAAGQNFDEGRGNITLAYTRDHQDGVLYNDRDFLRANVGGAGNPTTAQAATLGRPAGVSFQNDGRLNGGIGFNDSATDGFPGTVQVINRTLPLLTRGGLITAAFTTPVTGGASVAGAVQNFQFDRSGNLIPFNRGIRFLSVQEASGGDGFRFNDYSQITSDLKRDIFNSFASYDFADAAKVYFEGTYFHSRGDELVQQPSFNSSLFGGSSGALTFQTSSPFLTDQARAQLTALGVQRFQISRASSDLADLTGFSTNDLYRVTSGLKGDFTLFNGRRFYYDLNGNFGRVDIKDTRQDINAQNFINAVNVVRNGAGQIVCTATPAVQAAPGGTPIADAACVPLNLLGEGLSDPRARAYVVAENVTRSRLTQRVFTATMGGSPFALFGNDTAFSVGYEHRDETGSFTPSQFEQTGLGRSVAISPVRGRYNTDEFFGEAQLNLVTPNNDLGFLNALELFGRGRQVQNSINGKFFSWAAGGRVAPIRDIAFRGNYTKSFRAPAITELFSPLGNVFTTVPDLCSPANIGAGPNGSVARRANCGAFLTAFPNATPLDAAAATVPGRNGGNINLNNEVAKSFTYGVVLQPRYVPGLTLTVDYIDIKIRNPIASLTVAQIAAACFDNTDFNTADPANGNAFCSQIQRYAQGAGGASANGGNRGGQVISDPLNPGVTSGFVNGNRVKFSGIQAAMDYYRPLSGLGVPGRAGFDGSMLYTRRRVNDITGVAPVRIDGTLGDPKFQGQLNFRYIGDGFGVSMSTNYIGKQLVSRVSRGADIREVDHLNDFVLLNPSLYIEATKDFRLTFSVSNLLDRNGQKYFGQILPLSYSGLGFDQLGRRFSVSARARF